MTLTQLKTTVAAYLQCATTDFTSGGVDLFLAAVNQARNFATSSWDFEFCRGVFYLDINTGQYPGADMADVVPVSAPSGSSGVTIATVIDIGQLDTNDNFIPVEWTTKSESQIRQRYTNPGSVVRYPSDGQATSGPNGRVRVIVDETNVSIWPLAETGETLRLYIDAYCHWVDWTSGDLNSSFPPWTSIGEQYLQWASIVHLNYLRKEFVPRTEGNLGSPTELMQLGLEALKTWDTGKFEQYRRHRR